MIEIERKFLVRDINWGQPLSNRRIEQGYLFIGEDRTMPPILKTRHVVVFGGKNWEIDVFDGASAGLIVAEIELESEEESFALPPWIGPEVTDDDRFFNAALAQTPFLEWGISYAELLAEKER